MRKADKLDFILTSSYTMQEAVERAASLLSENPTKHPPPMTYLTSGGNRKLIKGTNKQYVTAGLFMAPADKAKLIVETFSDRFTEEEHHIVQTMGTVCPLADMALCKKPCLNTAGMLAYPQNQCIQARKTIAYVADRSAFMQNLIKDTFLFSSWATAVGLEPVIRPNGTSDIPYEKFSLFYNDTVYESIIHMFPEVHWYDYTKIAGRLDHGIKNYALTFSYSNANPAYAKFVTKALASSSNIAVVFRNEEVKQLALKHGFLGRRGVDGDLNDQRFIDPPSVFVALIAKGKAISDKSGFVVDADQIL